MSKRFNLRLPDKIKSIVDYEAKERGITQTEYIVHSIIFYNKYLHDDLDINDILIKRLNEVINIMQEGFQAQGAKTDTLTSIIQALADVDHGPRYLNNDK